MLAEGYALVLSGGGAKGVYHLGVWKALNELHIKIDAVVGNSVGALVAGFIAQGNYNIAEKALADLGIEKIISLPEEVVEDGQFVLNTRNVAILKKLQKKFLKNGGLDNTPLRNFLKKYLNEKKIRKNKADLGIITFQINKMKPVEIFLENIEEGLLLDYILASATFPGFKMTEIKKNKYIDGGVYNNIPFSMAKERGYKRIIVVDISGVGVNRRPDIAGTHTIYIKNSIDMGGTFDFDKNFLKNYKQLGYLDTLKLFNRIAGIDYFYHADTSLYKKLEKIFFSKQVQKYCQQYLAKEVKQKLNDFTLQIKSLLPKTMQHNRQLIHCLAECAARSLNIEKINLYNFADFIKIIWDNYNQVEDELRKLKQRFNRKTVLDLAKHIIDLSKDISLDKLMQKSVYEYDRILEELLKGKKKKFSFSTLNVFYPFIHAARIFFAVLKEYFKS